MKRKLLFLGIDRKTGQQIEKQCSAFVFEKINKQGTVNVENVAGRRLS